MLHKPTSDLQDPSYPVYVDTSVLMGNTGEYNEASSNFDDLTYMACKPDNDFFPDLSKAERTGAHSPLRAPLFLGPVVCWRSSAAAHQMALSVTQALQRSVNTSIHR